MLGERPSLDALHRLGPSWTLCLFLALRRLQAPERLAANENPCQGLKRQHHLNRCAYQDIFVLCPMSPPAHHELQGTTTASSPPRPRPAMRLSSMAAAREIELRRASERRWRTAVPGGRAAIDAAESKVTRLSVVPWCLPRHESATGRVSRGAACSIAGVPVASLPLPATIKPGRRVA